MVGGRTRTSGLLNWDKSMWLSESYRSYLALRNLIGEEKYLMTSLDLVVFLIFQIFSLMSFTIYLDQSKRP